MGIDKFYLFRDLLDIFAERVDEVTGADMDNYCGDIEISGVCGNHKLRLTVSITKKEENKDD